MKRILVPIDFSDFSRRALDHALAVAKWYGSTITLLHVVPVPPVVAYATGSGVIPSAIPSQEDRDALVASMRRFAATETEPDARMSFEIAEGTAAPAILAHAESAPTDLIVMGTHGRSGFERLVMGSVTEKVLRKAMCPVLSVPRHTPDAIPAPPVLFTRILCAIDFSDCSMEALDYAASLAREAGGRLTVVHVIEVPPEMPSEVHETMLGWPKTLHEYVSLSQEDRRARLQDAVAPHVSSAVDTILATGKPFSQILRVAAEQSSELIVIGIHGRGAADLLFFGSTAQHVVRQASCPVLTIRKG